MGWLLWVGVGLGYLLLLVLMWSLLVVASDADDQAELSFEEWKAQRNGN